MARLYLCFMLVASLVYYTLAIDMYSDKYDNFDIDSVLNNEKILTNYIKCMMDQGPCTKEGRDLKNVLPDALQTQCSKCSKTQKNRSDKVLKFLKKNRPIDFDHLSAKYDPNGEYKKYIDTFNS